MSGLLVLAALHLGLCTFGSEYATHLLTIESRDRMTLTMKSLTLYDCRHAMSSVIKRANRASVKAVER